MNATGSSLSILQKRLQQGVGRVFAFLTGAKDVAIDRSRVEAVKRLNFVLASVEKAVKIPNAGQVSSVWQLLSFAAINIGLVSAKGRLQRLCCTIRLTQMLAQLVYLFVYPHLAFEVYTVGEQVRSALPHAPPSCSAISFSAFMWQPQSTKDVLLTQTQCR
jgi:hypothetical protein